LTLPCVAKRVFGQDRQRPRPCAAVHPAGRLRVRPDDVGAEGAVGKLPSHLSLLDRFTATSSPRLLYGLSPELLLERE
jgi:hypothetical protein